MKSGIVGVDDLEGVGIVIIAAGINEKAGGALDHNEPAGRLRLLDHRHIERVKLFHLPLND
jgi:hypothetical protein